MEGPNEHLITASVNRRVAQLIEGYLEIEGNSIGKLAHEMDVNSFFIESILKNNRGMKLDMFIRIALHCGYIPVIEFKSK